MYEIYTNQLVLRRFDERILLDVRDICVFLINFPHQSCYRWNRKSTNDIININKTSRWYETLCAHAFSQIKNQRLERLCMSMNML